MAKKLSPMEMKAGSSVLDDLRKTAQDLMKGKLDAAKKVTVASNSKEGLKAGLSKAEEMLGAQKGPMHADSVPGKLDIMSKLKEHGMANPEHELEEGSEEEEMDESPEEAALEGDDSMSESQIDEQIKQLMAKKAKMKY